MKMNQSGIGVALSKVEQKMIKGGSACPTGDTVECFCEDGTTIFTGQWSIRPNALCNETQFCGSHGGTLGQECIS